MAIIKGVFLLPLKDNDGSDLIPEITEAIQAVYDRFRGWTREGRVTGAFRVEDGAPKLDECEKYMVFFDEARVHELEQVLQSFKAKTTQEAIYLELQRHVEIRLL